MESHGNLYSGAGANVPLITRSSKRYLDQGARSERIYRLKRTRAGKKANVTKLRNEVQQLMADYKNIDKVSEKFVELDNAMQTFRDAHLKYAELTDEFDIDESKEYYDSEEAKVSRLLNDISTWINTEKRRIEETIADFTSDVGVSPQDCVSNIGRRNLPSSRNSKGLRRQRSIFSQSANSMISGERSRAPLIIEASTLHKRQAIQMKECLLESEIQKAQLEQDRARLELEHRKEQLKLETELLKIQAREDGIISHASLNLDNNHDENRKISQVSILPQQPAPECLARDIPGRMEFKDSANVSALRLLMLFNAKRKGNFRERNSLTLLERNC